MSKTILISTSAANSFALKNDAIYDGVGGDLYLGGSPDLSNANVNTWIPFANFPFAKGKVITSATLLFYASANNAQGLDVNVGCEDADNAAAPANGAALNAKVQTSAIVNYVPGGYTGGVQYSVDVTAAVQEVLDRAGWVAGNTLAVFIKDNGTGGSDRRTIAAFAHATYTEAQLQVVYPYFVPPSGGVF